MVKIRQISDYLEAIAPVRLAEEWDNVGLLVGDRQRTLNRIMTCLTITPATAAEAIEKSADLIVTHHPLPFRALKRLTTDSTVGRLLWELVGHQISIYSPHTAWDSAAGGINQQLATGLGLAEIKPLEPITGDPDQLGSGRRGVLAQPESLEDFVTRVKSFLSLDALQYVGQRDAEIRRVGIACGSAGTFLPAAAKSGCQLLLTGETTFHTCLEAESLGVGLVLPGHFASERFSLEQLATVLASEFPDLSVWASDRETDPVAWI
ncbi:MAG: Nif3-like dinuclear metal center hexameric protein [Planctomycetaceae bacterium]|nr:Nif3-like dinuclear metal center hexameric protein [Planctomycetaceae bacterium]